MMRRVKRLILSLALIAGCDRGPQSSGSVVEDTPEPAAPAHDRAPAHPSVSPSGGAPSAGGLTWRVEAPLESRPPDNIMRSAEYSVNDFPDATLSVFHFASDEGGGGDVQGNIDRWVGQFTQPDGRPSSEVAHVEERRVNDLPVTLVQVHGTFVGRMGMGGPQEPRENWHLLGAIVRGPHGLVFFKLTGSEAAVEHARAAFDHLVDSVHTES
jgi:hypothetical protein